MTRNFVIVTGPEGDRLGPNEQLTAFVNSFGPSEVIELTTLRPQRCLRAAAVIIDVNLDKETDVLDLARKLPRPWRDGSRLLFITDRRRRSIAQAFSLGASEAFRFPADKVRLAAVLSDLSSQGVRYAEQLSALPGVAVARQALGDMFEAAERDRPIDMKALSDAGASIDLAIARGGIDEWVTAVRQYHRGTYQHCLLVAGVTVAFGQALGFRRQDRDRIAKAALVHDIGKSSIPVGILDKPGRLTDEEMVIMRTHAEAGSRLLLKHHPNEPELTDIARHHHELLDGSGYPDGLSGSDIADPVRLVTICDIYSALIESRSYKPPFSRAKAIEILVAMGPKLDRDIVAAFVSFVSNARPASTAERSIALTSA